MWAYDHRKFGSAGMAAQIGISIVIEYEWLLPGSFEALSRVSIFVTNDDENAPREGCPSLRGDDNRVEDRPIVGLDPSSELHRHAEQELNVSAPADHGRRIAAPTEYARRLSGAKARSVSRSVCGTTEVVP